MISPKSIQLIIKHFDSIDEAVAKRLMRRRPWSEPSLTSLLCDLLDNETQEDCRLRYPLADLNRDLLDVDGLLSVSFSIDSHEYDQNYERWVTQADLGLVISFKDEIDPRASWRTVWLLQAKKLYPSKGNPVEYNETSRFRAVDKSQHARMEEVEKVVGCSFIRYLLYCPRPAMLDETTSAKLIYLRNQELSKDIFDYALGLQLYDELASRDSSLSAGLFVTSSTDLPNNLADVHSGLLNTCYPFAWFIIYHLSTGNHCPLGNNMCRKGWDSHDDSQYELAEKIVSGNPKAIKELLQRLDNENNMVGFSILPRHTLTIRISVGENLDPEYRRLRSQ